MNSDTLLTIALTAFLSYNAGRVRECLKWGKIQDVNQNTIEAYKQLLNEWKSREGK